MIHGPDISQVRERAKSQLMWQLVNQVELGDRVPPTQRAMYVLRAAEAKTVLTGGESTNRCIEREAEQRGYTPFEMATIIDWMAGESIELEMRRLAANIRIDTTDEVGVSEILAEFGIELQIP